MGQTVRMSDQTEPNTWCPVWFVIQTQNVRKSNQTINHLGKFDINFDKVNGIFLS